MKSLSPHISLEGHDDPVKLIDNSHLKEFQKSAEEKAKLKTLKAAMKKPHTSNK